jgi:hypothetical protein
MDKFTPGPWTVPHLAQDDCECNCASVLADGYFGSVATISVDNGKRVGEGGNDSPPLEEAKANARLIAAAPELLSTMREVLRITDRKHDAWTAAYAAIAKATGTPP